MSAWVGASVQPTSEQLTWLKNGQAKERFAIYLDTIYCLSDEKSIEARTLASFNSAELEDSKEARGLDYRLTFRLTGFVRERFY